MILVLDEKGEQALKGVLEYILETEAEDFEKNGGDSHVYALASLVADAIDGQQE